MVFKYKRKSNRGSWTEETMQKAMNEAKTTSISLASKKYGIPIGTLQRHIKKGDASKKLGRFQPVFSKELEQKICDLAIERDTLFYGLIKDSLQQLAYEVATQNKIPHPFTCEKAGRAWIEGFMKRHPQLTYRTPEPTALARCSAFNRTQVDRFYDNLWSVISQHNFLTRPDDIYNMDETGVKTSASRPPRVISVKSKKQVGVVATAEKGQLTTVICACSATGRFIPPCFIFGQRKRMNERLLDGAPNGSQAWCSDSGWITNNTFNNWLQIFIDKTRPAADRPILLILDNHTTHQNLEALNLAREKHVIMVSIPPHTSHKLQPLDVSVYRSFKVAFEQTLDTFQKNHPGRRVTQFDIAKLVCTAYEKSATVQNATSGFRKAGIFPYNRNLFTDLDFAPATVYENAPMIAENQNATVTGEGDKNTDTQDSILIHYTGPGTGNATVTLEEADLNANVDNKITEEPATNNAFCTENCDNVAANVGVDDVVATVEKEISRDNHILEEKQYDEENFDTQNKTSEDNMLKTSLGVVDIILDQPSTSCMISSSKILPSPKVNPTIKKRKVRSQKSEILTSSPFNDTIEKKHEMKKRPKLALLQTSKEKENKYKKDTYENKGKGKGKGNGKGKRAEKDDKVLQHLEQPSQEDVFCLFCDEQYVEPLTEDWIQCPSCCGWAHELCTDTEDVSFLCVNCKM